MRQAYFSAILLASVAISAPLQSEPAPTVPNEEAQSAEEGRSLMQRGAQMFLDGMRREMSPAVEELRDLMANSGPMMQQFLRDMGPAMAELLGKIDDLRVYEMPEILPNGDIIIRRKPDAGPLPPPAADEIDI